MKLIESRPSRLHCETCKETYNLPQNGTMKVFKELRCPLDDFELVVYVPNSNSKVIHQTNYLFETIRSILILKSFSFCPYCYNNPPFKDMRKNAGCNECAHPSCAYSLAYNSLCSCPACNEGTFYLDVTHLPKHRLHCSKYVFQLFFSF